LFCGRTVTAACQGVSAIVEKILLDQVDGFLRKILIAQIAAKETSL
jgi:hypothetical protein